MKYVLSQILAFRKLPIRWYWLLVIGGLLVVFQVTQRYIQHRIAGYNYEFSWGPVSASLLVNYLVWFCLLPSIYWGVRYLKWRTLMSRPRQLFGFAIGFFTVAIIHRLTVSRSIDFINYFRTGYLREFLGANSFLDISVGVFSSALELLAIVILLYAIVTQRKNVEQQRILARAQLNALRMQLNPHFLFNTLHSISSLIDIDVKKAQKMLAKLGSLLRKVLESDDQQFVALQDELLFIEEYLDIEQVRFEDLDVRYQIDDESRQQAVPYLILQPLVENAIKFGMDNVDGITDIEIRACYDQLNNSRGLKMEVENHLNPVKTVGLKGTGIGLQNVRKRLEQLYESFVLETEKLQGNRFIVRIIIPAL